MSEATPKRQTCDEVNGSHRKRRLLSLPSTTAEPHREALLPITALAPNVHLPTEQSVRTSAAIYRSGAALARPTQDEGNTTAPGKPVRCLPSRLTNPTPGPAQRPELSLAECRVIYVATALEVDWWAQRILQDQHIAAVALDIEWRVTFKTGDTPRPAAVVQLAYRRPLPPAGEAPCTCVLLHVAASGLTPELCSLLQANRPLKVGVGIHGDALKMQRDWGLQLGGLVDLSEAAQDRGICNGEAGAKWSLADLTKRVLKATLAKPTELRLSDWEARPLSPAQASYAALDAFACLRIHEDLQQLPVLPAVLTAKAAAATAAAAAHAKAAVCKPCTNSTANAETAVDDVPAALVPLRLQPAKQAVYSAFHDQGMSMAAIAALKRIQPSTVQGFLAEAVLFGHAYRWQSFGVSDAVLAAVEEAAAAVLCSAPACTSAAAVDIQPQHLAPAPGEFLSTAAAPENRAGPVPGPAAAQKAAAPAAAVPSHASNRAPWATGVFAADDSDSDDDRTVAACMQAAAAMVKREPATAGCSPRVSSPVAHVAAQCPRSSAATMARDRVAFQAAAKFEATTGFLMIDLAARLSAAGVTMRTFRERLAVDVDLGQIRLALAHLGRTAARFLAFADTEIQQHVQENPDDFTAPPWA